MKKYTIILITSLVLLSGCASSDCAKSPENGVGKLSSKRNVTTILCGVDKPKGIACVEDVRFSPACTDPQVLLDIYYPEDLKSKKPCLLFVHGGGWTIGNHKKFALFAAYAASRGYVAASCTYRLMPEYEVKDSAEDVQRALLWLKKNASKYGGDPARIGIIGGSAGGHLSALIAMSGGNADFCKNVFENIEDSKVQACIAMAPVTDLRKLELAKKLGFKGGNEEAWNLSAMKYVTKDSPPLLLLHATGDKVVPLSHSETLINAYKKAGAKIVEHKFYDYDKHAFWNLGLNDDFRMTSWNDALAFFDKILKKSN